jgi:hypothetical protein
MSDKHPIDELFSDKLREHELQPSAAAWEKIAQKTQAKSTTSFRPAYLLRAAVVTLLIGLSSLIYFQNNTKALLNPEGSVTATTTKKTNTAKKQKTAQEEPKGDNPEKTEPKKPVKKRVPVLKTGANGGSKTIFVSNGNSDSENLDMLVAVEETWPTDELEDITLDVSRLEDWKKPPVKLKLKYTKPVSGDWSKESVAEGNSQKKDLKDKVFAYANTQFDNLINGKKMDLPKLPKGKPQLEINLDKILKNQLK